MRFPLESLLEVPQVRQSVLDWVHEDTRRVFSDRPDGCLAGLFGVHRRTVARWWDIGLDRVQADVAACSVGLHPLSVWPDWS